MDWLIPLGDVDFDAEEESAVLEVLRSRWLTMGSVTQTFEKDFATMIGSRHAIAVTNANAVMANNLQCPNCFLENDQIQATGCLLADNKKNRGVSAGKLLFQLG